MVMIMTMGMSLHTITITLTMIMDMGVMGMEVMGMEVMGMGGMGITTPPPTSVAPSPSVLSSMRALSRSRRGSALPPAPSPSWRTPGTMRPTSFR